MKKEIKLLFVSVIAFCTLAMCAFAIPGAVITTDAAIEISDAVQDDEAVLLAISGSGTATDPFIVVTEEDLMLVSDFPDCHFKLANDIALTSTDWEPLCVLGDPFSGTFDGDGYTISNLTITSSETENGLFSENAGTIKNLNVETSTTGVLLSTYTGILAGKNSGTIENCNVTGEIYRASGNMTAVYAGGFVGYNSGTINRCTASGTIDVSMYISSSSDTYRIYVGGFAGYNTNNLTECYADVDLSADKCGDSSSRNSLYYDIRIVGGFLGGNIGGTVSSCFSQGTICLGGHKANTGSYAYEARCAVGGFIGSNNGTVENCATISTISKIDDYVTIYSGGLAYYNNGVSSTTGTITNCYAVTSGVLNYGLAYSNTATGSFYDKTVSGKTDTYYGTPKSTAAMKMAMTYTNAGWDFDSTWAISEDVNDGYPHLQWMYETTYKVSYDANGGEGAPDSQRKYEDADLVLSDVVPARDGYKFLGWATSADASEAEYIAGATYSENAELTLYAVWEKIYYITYNANGGEGAPETQIKDKNVDLVITISTPTRVGYKFLGWAASADAEEVEYLPNDTYSLNSDLDLYAVWEKLYVITYGYSLIDIQYKENDVDVALSDAIPTMELRTFLGWATSPDSDVVEYAPGDNYSENADLNLYAVWKNLYVDINIGEKQSSDNVRYYEIDGNQYALTENSDNLFRVVPEKDVLVEITEKESADSVYAVSAKYYLVDYETMTYSELGLSSFMHNYGGTSIRIAEPKGIRYKAKISNAAKYEAEEYVVEEYGYIVAVQSDLDAANAQLNLDFGRIARGVAYNKADRINVIYDSTDDEWCVFSGVLKNIPESRYATVLTSKTYTKVSVAGETYTVYGEEVSASIYEIAKSILASSEELDEETVAELERIVKVVDGEPEVEEPDNEIIVDGDHMFGN